MIFTQKSTQDDKERQKEQFEGQVGIDNFEDGEAVRTGFSQTELEAQQESEDLEDESDAVHDLEQEIEQLKGQLKEKEDKYLYLYADFDNYKKRAVKERSELIKFGWESVARDLLNIVDNLKRAIEHMPQKTDPALADGIRMVLTHFLATLDRQGVKPIECLQQNFDPNFHEAVGQEFSDQPSGVIIREQGSGYLLHGRLLRPSRVIISQGQKNN